MQLIVSVFFIFFCSSLLANEECGEIAKAYFAHETEAGEILGDAGELLDYSTRIYLFDKISENSCHLYLGWDSSIGCAMLLDSLKNMYIYILKQKTRKTENLYSDLSQFFFDWWETLNSYIDGDFKTWHDVVVETEQKTFLLCSQNHHKVGI